MVTDEQVIIPMCIVVITKGPAAFEARYDRRNHARVVVQAVTMRAEAQLPRELLEVLVQRLSRGRIRYKGSERNAFIIRQPLQGKFHVLHGVHKGGHKVKEGQTYRG
jgi:hypothetical protein